MVGGDPELPGREVVRAHASSPHPWPAPTQSKAAPSILAVIGPGVQKREPLIGFQEVQTPMGPPPCQARIPFSLICYRSSLFSPPEGNVGRSERRDVAARFPLLRAPPLAGAELPSPFHSFRVLAPLAWPVC